jgi:hypothetical protein
MTKDDIIGMALKADCLDEQHYGSMWADKLEQFATLVAAAERKACADLCEELWRKGGWDYNAGYAADKIRARGLHNMNKEAEDNGEIL